MLQHDLQKTSNLSMKIKDNYLNNTTKRRNKR